jgi:xanthine dehydrogenase accessory factor
MSEDRAVYEALIAAKDKGELAALATVIHVQGSVPRHAGSKMLVRQDGSIVGTVGGGGMESQVIKEALAAMQDGQTRMPSYTLHDPAKGDPGICGGTIQIFIEPIAAAPTLLVIGGGHVGKALAELGLWLGWRVVLSDDRPDFCNPNYVAGLADYVVCKPAEIAEKTPINSQTYIAAVTRGMPIDVNLIPVLLATNAAYIGVIGSRRRWALTMKTLREEHGLSEADFKRVYAPIGLELNAETPQEIAISIMAQITMIRRGGDGSSMQWTGDKTEQTEKLITLGNQ